MTDIFCNTNEASNSELLIDISTSEFSVYVQHTSQLHIRLRPTISKRFNWHVLVFTSYHRNWIWPIYLRWHATDPKKNDFPRTALILSDRHYPQQQCVTVLKTWMHPGEEWLNKEFLKCSYPQHRYIHKKITGKRRKKKKGV